jgi:hypothetical protein
MIAEVQEGTPNPVVGPLILGYGIAVLFFAANRGRKYLRFILPFAGRQEPYRLWLVGFAFVLIGAVLTIATWAH